LFPWQQHNPWYGVSQGALLVAISEKRHQVTRERNNFLQIMFTMVYAMNQNGWLALIICREKKSEKLQFTKQAFLANTQHQCFAFCKKSKASLRLRLFCMMKYMHQYKQKEMKIFWLCCKNKFLSSIPYLNLLKSRFNHCPNFAIQ